jgi:hypothetical protein
VLLILEQGLPGLGGQGRGGKTDVAFGATFQVHFLAELVAIGDWIDGACGFYGLGGSPAQTEAEQEGEQELAQGARAEFRHKKLCDNLGIDPSRDDDLLQEGAKWIVAMCGYAIGSPMWILNS